MESNQTIQNVGIPVYEMYEVDALKRALGVDSANLFLASLNMNAGTNKVLVERHQVLWSHAVVRIGGKINLGDDPSIPMGVMHRILSWFGGGNDNEINSTNSNGTNDANFFQYHRPSFSTARIGTMRLDSIHRIFRSMPDLCQRNDGETRFRDHGRVCSRAGAKRKLDEVVTL